MLITNNYLLDINECTLGIHECAPNEKCVNEEGSYYCDDPVFDSKTDLETDDNLEVSKCPAGYKFNYEKLVCDGKYYAIVSTFF